LSRLKAQEDSIRKSIESALERETLEKSNKASKKGYEGKGSNELRGELEGLKEKVKKGEENRKKIEERKDIGESREKVEKCYR